MEMLEMLEMLKSGKWFFELRIFQILDLANIQTWKLKRCPFPRNEKSRNFEFHNVIATKSHHGCRSYPWSTRFPKSWSSTAISVPNRPWFLWGLDSQRQDELGFQGRCQLVHHICYQLPRLPLEYGSWVMSRKTWPSHRLYWTIPTLGTYPLDNIQKTMENHHV